MGCHALERNILRSTARELRAVNLTPDLSIEVNSSEDLTLSRGIHHGDFSDRQDNY